MSCRARTSLCPGAELEVWTRWRPVPGTASLVTSRPLLGVTVRVTVASLESVTPPRDAVSRVTTAGRAGGSVWAGQGAVRPPPVLASCSVSGQARPPWGLEAITTASNTWIWFQGTYEVRVTGLKGDLQYSGLSTEVLLEYYFSTTEVQVLLTSGTGG